MGCKSAFTAITIPLCILNASAIYADEGNYQSLECFNIDGQVSVFSSQIDSNYDREAYLDFLEDMAESAEGGSGLQASAKASGETYCNLQAFPAVTYVL